MFDNVKDLHQLSTHDRQYRHPIEDKILCWITNNGITTPLRMAAVLQRLRHQTLPEIKKDIPALKMKSLVHARAYFASQYPELYKPHFSNNLKVLIDENIDPHFTTDMARRAFGEAAHVTFIDRSEIKTKLNKDYSISDAELWKYARKHGYDIILTKDRAEVETRNKVDLSRCATLTWKWLLQINNGVVSDTLRTNVPRLLRITDASMDAKTISRRLHEEKESIVEIFEEAVSDTIELGRTNVKPGKDIFEILHGKVDPRLQRKISEHAKKILCLLEIDHLPYFAQKRIKETIRARVKHDMAGDFAKIPLTRHKQRQRALAELTNIVEKEQDAYLQAQELKKLTDKRKKEVCVSLRSYLLGGVRLHQLFEDEAGGTKQPATIVKSGILSSMAAAISSRLGKRFRPARRLIPYL